MNPIESTNPRSKVTGVIFEGFRRRLITNLHKEQSSNKYDNNLFVFKFANLQYMLFRIMAYIEKSHFACVKIYHDKLFQHHKAVIKGDRKATKTVIFKGGREMT